MEPVIQLDRAEIFFDGVFSEPRLSHPEGIAIDVEGNVWCGGDRGEIFRISADGENIEQAASTDGFILGLAFDSDENLYACDMRYQAVFRLGTRTGRLEKFAEGGQGKNLRAPNFPVVDAARGCLYVSDSYDPHEKGPGVWRFDLASGEGGLWCDEPMTFANGMSLSLDGDSLYVVESFARKITRITILDDGSPGPTEEVVSGLERVPDGLVCDAEGNLFVGCYEPSRIYRVSADGSEISLFVDDPEAHTLCHPTNLAFRGEELLVANLGRWHITRIDARTKGMSLL